MTRFFSCFKPIPSETITPVDGNKPAVMHQQSLPFNDLDPRLFEVLCYRLKRKQHPEAQVDLMQGTNDGGRDVVVYRHGQVVEIVQCKKLKVRLSKPDLIEEICKIALHHHLDPTVIEARFHYEIWCPSGLSAPAAEVINRWPQKWTEREVKPHAMRLLKLPTFSTTSWSKAKETILKVFPQLVSPHKEEGADIAAKVKQHHDILAEFFTVNVALPQIEMRAEVRRLFAEGGIYQVASPELAQIVERINSYSAQETMRTFHSYIFGVKPEFLAALNPGELKTFIGHLESTSGVIMKVTTEVGIRRARELIKAHHALIKERDPLFGHCIQWLTKLIVLARGARAVGGLQVTPAGKGLVDFDGASEDEQIDNAINIVCDISEGKGRGGLDEGYCNQLARLHSAFGTRELMAHRAWGLFHANCEFVATVRAELNAFLPGQVVVVSDGVNVFSNGSSLLDSFKRTMNAITDAWQMRQKE